MKKRRIKIGFDLDGVIIDRPPLVPKTWLERLFRGTKDCGLVYNFPTNRGHQWLRKLSHHSFFRPPIRKNLTFLKKISQDPNFEVYLISGRYSFLEKETAKWLAKKGLGGNLSGVFINEADLLPHIFKKKIIKKLGLDFYFEDDNQIVSFLRKEIPQTKIYRVDSKNFDFFKLIGQ
ncbi:MAG: hypothetical protein PHR64_00460 [Candidatus Shapirobacteria bacterium]|nr:hypothetical protein [Candidatus Shapirobacteria bacterium]MDD5073630.1 hypothetical protein [Candidatus Shapirobacteria bacterium]MDD5481409.1 hypothetical protein [Candidatus Shapirobacteria bacterium]